jgi:hypothetical protein
MSYAAHVLNRGERKSLAYHEAVAERLCADPSLVGIVRTRLQWYRERNPSSASYYDQWASLLSGPLSELINVMVGTSSECCAMRQENPFVDLISQRERAAIYRQVVEEIDGEAR